MSAETATATHDPGDIALIGKGRLGTALAGAMRRAGLLVTGPIGREGGRAVGDAGVILLCVPDAAVADVAGELPRGRIVGHCSGALGLQALEPHERFSMHPLLSVTRETSSFAGAGCAVDGSTPRARAACTAIATALGMRPFAVSDELRVLYHAAASVAAGYVVTVAAYAESLMSRARVDRALLAPLVRSAIENWAAQGARGLTGPIVRGDEQTVARQRDAVLKHAPDSVALWDALAAATRTLAAAPAAPAPAASAARGAPEPEAAR